MLADSWSAADDAMAEIRRRSDRNWRQVDHATTKNSKRSTTEEETRQRNESRLAWLNRQRGDGREGGRPPTTTARRRR